MLKMYSRLRWPKMQKNNYMIFLILIYFNKMKKRNQENFIYNIKQRHPKTLRSVTINTELFSKKKSTDI